LREKVALHAENGRSVQGCCVHEPQHAVHVATAAATAAAADAKPINSQERQPALVKRREDVHPGLKGFHVRGHRHDPAHSSHFWKQASACCYASPAVDKGGSNACERLRRACAVARQGEKSRHRRRICSYANGIGSTCSSSVRKISDNYLQQAVGAPSEDNRVTETCARANDRSAASIATAVARSVSVIPNSRREECVGRRPYLRRELWGFCAQA
jgi:hypothetical protein